MKTKLALAALLALGAVSSVTAAHASMIRTELPRVHFDAQRIVDAAGRILDAVRLANPAGPRHAWSRGFALGALRQLEHTARVFASHRTGTHPVVVRRDFRRLQTRFVQAHRVFASLRPTPSMRADWGRISRRMERITQAVRGLAWSPTRRLSRKNAAARVHAPAPRFRIATWAPAPGLDR